MRTQRERRRRRAKRFCSLAGGLSLLLLLTNDPGLAQSRSERETSAERPSFRIGAQTVLLQLTVIDEEGEPVAGLERHHFSVFEDGVPQEITYFEHNTATDAAPTAIVLLIDTSSSMRGADLAEARNAALRFLRGAPTHAEIAIVAFNHEISLIHDFTQDRRALVEAVHRLAAGGGTSLYEGLVDAIERLDGSSSTRRLLVVLSDGKDLDSVTRFADVRRRLESSPVVVHAVGYYSSQDRELFVGAGQFYKEPPLEVNLNPAWVLEETARLSGGAAYFPLDPMELEPLFSEIARGVRLQYLLAYSPSSVDGEPPRFREIQVCARRGPAGMEPLTVRARRGYVR